MTTDGAPSPSAYDDRPPLPVPAAWAVVVAIGLAVWGAAAWRAGDWLAVAWGWRLLAVFLSCIAALMLRPIAGGAAVLLALIATVFCGALSIDEALGGYKDKTVWLVLAAYFLSRAFIKTGLARRIALGFVRLLGRNTLGLSYALACSDTILAGMIPSNAARVGGVLLPITRGLAELYESFPGKSARRLGAFLMLALYQSDVVSCALFLTGQAGNVLAARQARDLTADLATGPIVLDYGSWFWLALIPAAASLVLAPALVYWWYRPEIAHTPHAREFAATELRKLGPMSRGEWTLLIVFIGVCGCWIGLGADATTPVALAAVGALLLTGVLTWNDAISERAAWDVFIWYGGLVQMGVMLKDTGLINDFAARVADLVAGREWLVVFLTTLLIYFYAHYAFASITTHLLTMYPAFVGVLIAAGAPPLLVVIAFAFVANFAAGLTHYGTTPGPIIFSLGYVPQRVWWRVGFRLSLVHLTVWLTLGMAWWRLLGAW